MCVAFAEAEAEINIFIKDGLLNWFTMSDYFLH